VTTEANFSQFKEARVLITGGCGFIGSNLARRLLSLGAQVTLIDSLIPEYGGNLANLKGIEDRLNINFSDVRDPYSLRFLVRNKDFLFNLAGQTSHMDSMTDPATDLAINAEAQLSILETCRKENKNVRIVFASTRQLYGRPQYLPVDEKHPLNPIDVNGINKLAGEMYHLLYNNVHGIRSSILRLTNTYGPGMRIKDARQTFVGIWIRNLLEGKPIEVWGGDQLRDFNHVDDVVEALLLSSLSPQAHGKVFNLGGNPTISLKELGGLLIKLLGSGSLQIKEFPEDRKKIDIGDYYSDFSLIQNTLSWSPKVSLEQGLTETLNYYSSHIKEYI
jgi:nucleoside-diphosphate-sugar epimerase